ncbi:MAG TPA: YkvA family protein [Pyrinomonadaceae bacterium]|nr:YkvA family protein [Pyrinomonadaceae bacterium]
MATADVKKGKPMGKSSVKKIGQTKLRSRMKNLLMFLPNMVVLSAKLMVDSRVPRTERALFAGAVIYAIIPFDFIPDMIPFIGQVDDLFLVALTLLRLIDRTDDLVVRQHWRGGGDIVQLAESAATIAPLLMPKRVARVLISKVKPASEGAGLLASAARREPVLVETPERENQPDRLSKLAEFGGKKRQSKSA